MRQWGSSGEILGEKRLGQRGTGTVTPAEGCVAKGKVGDSFVLAIFFSP